MAGEACGAWCGYCGRCDHDYATRCATKGCLNAVTFPDIEAFCSECYERFRLKRIRHEQADRQQQWQRKTA